MFVFLFSDLKAVTNLSLKSIKDAGVKQGLIVQPHKLFLVGRVTFNVATWNPINEDRV